MLSRVTLYIIDTHNTVVKTILDNQTFTRGHHYSIWNLHGDNGVPLAPGMYRAIINDGTTVKQGDIKINACQ